MLDLQVHPPPRLIFPSPDLPSPSGHQALGQASAAAAAASAAADLAAPAARQRGWLQAAELEDGNHRHSSFESMEDWTLLRSIS